MTHHHDIVSPSKSFRLSVNLQWWGLQTRTRLVSISSPGNLIITPRFTTMKILFNYIAVTCIIISWVDCFPKLRKMLIYLVAPISFTVILFCMISENVRTYLHIQNPYTHIVYPYAQCHHHTHTPSHLTTHNTHIPSHPSFILQVLRPAMCHWEQVPRVWRTGECCLHYITSHVIMYLELHGHVGGWSNC